MAVSVVRAETNDDPDVADIAALDPTDGDLLRWDSDGTRYSGIQPSALSATATGGSTARTLADWMAATDGVIIDRWYATLTLAASAAATATKTLYVTKAHTVATGFTISCPLFFAGGSISVDSGQTVTINAGITAPRAQIFSGSGTVTVNRCAVRPEWAGVKFDGATDDYAAWTRTVGLINASTGGEIDATGAAVSLVSDAIDFDRPIHLRCSYGKTQIYATHASNGILNITAQAFIDALTVNSSVTQTGGAYITLSSAASNSMLQDIKSSGAYVFIDTSATGVQIVRPNFRNGIATTGIGILVRDGLSVLIDSPLADNSSEIASGIKVLKAGDVTVASPGLVNCGKCLWIYAGTGDVITSVTTIGGFYDSSVNGVYIEAAGGTIQRVQFNGVEPATSSSHNIYITTSSGGVINGVRFDGGSLYNGSADGIHIADSTDIDDFEWNGGPIAGNASRGIYIGTGVGSFRLRGSMGPVDGFTANGSGIVLGGTNDNYTIDMDMTGQTAPLSGQVIAPGVEIKIKGATAHGTGNGKNLIMNGGFDIWQRGTSFAYGGGAAIKLADRWKGSRSSGLGGATFSRQTGFNGAQYCMRSQRDSGNTNTGNLRFWTQIETAKTIPLQSRRVIVSADVRKGADYSGGAITCLLATGTGTDESYSGGSFTTGNTNVGLPTITSTTTGTRYVWTFFDVPSTATELAFQFAWTPTGTASTNDYAEFTNVKLEEGDMATPFAPQDPAEVLAECQRFYEKSFETTTTPAQNIGAGTGEETFIATVAGAATNRSPRVQFKASKRITAPTITVYSPSAATAQVYDQTAAGACTAAAVVNNTMSGFHVTCTANAGTAVGGVLAYHWSADAEF